MQTQIQYQENVTTQLNNLVTVVPTFFKMEMKKKHNMILTQTHNWYHSKKTNSENNVQVCMEASTCLYRVEKKANLLHFLIEFTTTFKLVKQDPR